jgi:hypothetical protein
LCDQDERSERPRPSRGAGVEKRWPAANMRPPGRPDRAVPSRPGPEQGHSELECSVVRWMPRSGSEEEGARGDGVSSGLREALAVLRDTRHAPKEGAWWRHGPIHGIEARPDRASKASKPLPEHGLVVKHSSATKPAHVPLCAQHLGHLDGICLSWRADALVPRVSLMIRVLSALRVS